MRWIRLRRLRMGRLQVRVVMMSLRGCVRFIALLSSFRLGRRLVAVSDND